MTASVLIVIALVQLAFLGGTVFLLVGHRWILSRRVRRLERDEREFVVVVRTWLAGRLSPEQLRTDIDGRAAQTVAAVLQQYAAQIEGEQWERLVREVRRTRWLRRIRDEARSRFWWRRLAAARLLAVVASPEDLKVVSRLLGDDNPAIQIAAVAAITRVHSPELLETVLDKALSAPPVVRRFVFDVLASLRGPLTPLLVERLRNGGDAGERQAWVALAGELGVPDLLSHVLPFTEDENLDVRVAAARALSAFPHPTSSKVLSKLLADSEWQVRTQAAAALGTISAVEARAALKGALSDENWWVRLRAAIALRQFGQPGLEVLAQVRIGADRYAAEMANYILGLSAAAVADYAA